MTEHAAISSKDLVRAIKSRKITIAGNRKLKIYGRLSCISGKKMKKCNRVFFGSEQEAIDKGFRPCGHCMYVQYKKWKNEPFRNK